VTPRKLGILTSGGDAPGMNAAIRAVVRTAATLGIGVVAYRDGFCGLVDDVSTPLDINDVGNILQRGGTIIGTSRCPEFHDPKVRARAVEQMRAAGIDGLIVVGGDGSFRGAHALMAEHDVAVAGLTGTIDNDIPGTDETIGFHTAVDTAVRAIDKVRDTSESTGMMFFIEVMGRTSGAIAVATGVACGAAAVFVPGACESVEAVADLDGGRAATSSSWPKETSWAAPWMSGARWGRSSTSRIEPSSSATSSVAAHQLRETASSPRGPPSAPSPPSPADAPA
jgi:6-phosphofructokinase 1